ncbi:phage major capsid protein, partial [candidate division GN15 bacterium]|nr:phage major capsid protein [candidate division GN15 bacterium]
VNSPANMAALIDEAEAKAFDPAIAMGVAERQWADIQRQVRDKGIVLKHIIAESPEGGGQQEETTMDFEKKIQDVESSVTTVTGDVKTVKDTVEEQGARVKDLGKEFDAVAKEINDLKAAAAGAKKTDAEIRELVDKALGEEGEFGKKLEALSEKVNKVQMDRAKPRVSTQALEARDIKQLISYAPRELKRELPTQDYDLMRALQSKHDQVVLVDALLDASSRQRGLQYHEMPRAQRVKELKSWNEFDSFRKAMDTATSDEGAEFVPTDLSGTLMEDVRVATVVSPLFEEIMMTSGSMTVPVDEDDTIATLAGQTKTIVSAFDSTEQTPGTGEISLAAKKARGRYQVSQEFNEDSAIAVLPYLQRKIARSIARAEDRAIIDGDLSSGGTSHYSGRTVAATDFRHAWDGLLYHALSTIGSSKNVDLGTFTEPQFSIVRGNMGKYGIYQNQLAYIFGVSGYLMRVLRDFDDIQTLDKYGPNAVVLTGEAMRYNGSPIIISEFVPEDLKGDGLYDGTTTDRTVCIAVNRDMFLKGVRRSLQVNVVQDGINDVFHLVAFKRMDFKPKITPSTSVVSVNAGYNLATAS